MEGEEGVKKKKKKGHSSTNNKGATKITLQDTIKFPFSGHYCPV